MDNRLFKRLEIAGAPVVFTLAALLHGIYDWTGKSIIASLFGAVNESVWEHVKIFAVAYLVWAAVELLWARPPLKRFVAAKAAGVYFLGLSIIAFFYIYTFFTKKPVLAVDIAMGVVFTVAAMYVSYRLTYSPRNTGQYFYTGVMLLFLALIMIFCFSYYPPDSDVFRDPVTGIYGVVPEYIDTGAMFLDSLR